MLNYLSSKPENSKGRLIIEPENPGNRSSFERDRDRIIHSTAFRKLKQKTQVFIESESDYYRTRLTHTLEVSQITRSICRLLGLNEDLGECIALAHDLGHPPFGHSGENALNFKMKNYGGFNHNIQTFRIITELEKKYIEFNGLNLTWESLEGIIKHNGNFINSIPDELLSYNKRHNLELSKNPSLEAQVAAICDDIAYNNHDIDDAIRANLISMDELNEIDYFNNIISSIYNKYNKVEDTLLINEVIRISIDLMVKDISLNTRENTLKFSIKSLNDIKNYPNFLVTMSDKFFDYGNEIKKFLYKNVYNNIELEDKRKKSEIKIIKLFDYFIDNFETLPEDWKNKKNFMSKERIICDYIAGMTDRYATYQFNLLNEK